jgi:23S rRNA (cytidine1920-2'-O)/16S rRNA (cytidine1409-2'-O)-methyltransferase
MTTPRSRKSRADVLLVERGLAPSRARAQALIMAGAVTSRGARVEKAGELIEEGAELSVEPASRFVSRGGDKLAGALEAFAPLGLDVRDRVCVDIGASTGGFTDCLLQRGARKVYAVDVGYGQLAEKLRADPRVVVRERTNARDLQAADFDERIDLVVVDASFIGLGKLMAAVKRVLAPSGELVALVKPQFEAGRAAVNRGRGVIRDPGVRAAAIDKARADVESEGFTVVGETDSPLPGPKGNLERFVYAKAPKGG